jgi:hypothetical protein
VQDKNNQQPMQLNDKNNQQLMQLNDKNNQQPMPKQQPTTDAKTAAASLHNCMIRTTQNPNPNI